jgi:hypothetical protein
MDFEGSNSDFIGKIRWLTYGGATAKGKGLFEHDTCNPDCATGGYIYTPITVELTTRALCKGVVAYQDWTILGMKRTPPGYYPEPIIVDAFATTPGAACT